MTSWMAICLLTGCVIGTRWSWAAILLASCFAFVGAFAALGLTDFAGALLSGIGGVFALQIGYIVGMVLPLVLAGQREAGRVVARPLAVNSVATDLRREA
jgi:hypothetical protein